METNSLLDISHHFSTDVNPIFAFNPNGETCFSIARQVGLSLDSLVIPQQIHSTRVKWVETPGTYLGMDGIITSKTNLILSLKVADCVPVYFFEPQNNMIGLVHSGWRGTVYGIISNSIKLMHKKGADIAKILVYLGPAIGSCCYEVDANVANSFNDEAKLEINDRKWRVGLHNQIRLQLIELGLSITNIQVSEICTYESDKCHSYRRDGSDARSMYAFMFVK